MNYEVEKTEIHSGYAITFPFELKDAFRSSFKSAKWNSMLKRWEVGNRSGSRLEEWISEIKRSGVLESLKEANEANHSDTQIKNLRYELSKMKDKISEEVERLGNIKKAADIVSTLSIEISKAKELLESVNESRLEEQDKIEERISKIVSISRVESLMETMNRNMPRGKYKKSHSEMKSRFEEAQVECREIKSALEEIGIQSAIIDKLVYSNVNRPDRDDIENWCAEELYIISEL